MSAIFMFSARRVVARRLSATPPKKEPKLTREEVEAIAERARNEQKFWDTERKIFGGGIGWGHPLLLVLAGGAAALHFANAHRDQKREDGEAHLEKLRSARDDPAKLLAHKHRQLEYWSAKDTEEARDRVGRLRTEIDDLERKI